MSLAAGRCCATSGRRACRSQRTRGRATASFLTVSAAAPFASSFEASEKRLHRLAWLHGRPGRGPARTLCAARRGGILRAAVAGGCFLNLWPA